MPIDLDDFDDDLLDLTDDELDAREAAAIAEYQAAERAWEARTPRPQQYAHHRRGWLELCHKARHGLFTRMLPEMGRANLKRYQMGLWKTRWWYRTGHWPASDS